MIADANSILELSLDWLNYIYFAFFICISIHILSHVKNGERIPIFPYPIRAISIVDIAPIYGSIITVFGVLVSTIITANYTHVTKLAELSEKALEKRQNAYVMVLDIENKLSNLESIILAKDKMIEAKDFSILLSDFIAKLKKEYPFPSNQEEAEIIEDILVESVSWQSKYKKELELKNKNFEIPTFIKLKEIFEQFKNYMKKSMNSKKL